MSLHRECKGNFTQLINNIQGSDVLAVNRLSMAALHYKI